MSRRVTKRVKKLSTKNIYREWNNVRAIGELGKRLRKGTERGRGRGVSWGGR